MNEYYYLDQSSAPFRIRTHKKPSLRASLKGKTWVVEEWQEEQQCWIMPAIPEITYNALRYCYYIGMRKWHG